MPTRTSYPNGAPCWVDLMTSDPEGARAFYGDILGWTAEEPNPAFGGYVSFLRHGERIAGCMDNRTDEGRPEMWSVYLATDDVEATLAKAKDRGGEVIVPAMPVADLGTMAFLLDPGGAGIGLWQPGTHTGCAATGEPGTPSWFELHTRDYAASVAFYRDVFGRELDVMSDTVDFRYTAIVDPDSDGSENLAGIMDATVLPEETPTQWSVYFGVEDTAAALARVVELGGQVVHDVEVTPYGDLAAALDPTGAMFKLVAANESMPG